MENLIRLIALINQIELRNRYSVSVSIQSGVDLDVHICQQIKEGDQWHLRTVKHGWLIKDHELEPYIEIAEAIIAGTFEEGEYVGRSA